MALLKGQAKTVFGSDTSLVPMSINAFNVYLLNVPWLSQAVSEVHASRVLSLTPQLA